MMGKKVVCMATPSLNDHMNGDLYILDVEAEELQKMNVDRLLGGSVCFSPEGSKNVLRSKHKREGVL